METKLLAGIIGVIGFILGFGGSELISVDIVDNTYVCLANEKVGVFHRFSSTGVTGYYTDESGDERGKQCRGSTWQPIKDYAKENDVDPEVFIERMNEPEVETVDNVVYLEADCPEVRIVAYTDQGKYYCTAPGPDQICESDYEITLAFER